MNDRTFGAALDAYHDRLFSRAYDGDDPERLLADEAAALLAEAGYAVEDVRDDGFLVRVGDRVVCVSEDEDHPRRWEVSASTRLCAQRLGRISRHLDGDVLGDFRHAIRSLTSSQ